MNWATSFLSYLGRSARVFCSFRMMIVLLLGFSSGLPLALSGSTLAIWVKDAGGSLETIGLYSLVGLPYTLKFLWAPLLDAWRVPVLSGWLGQRRGWLMFSQLMLMVAILFLGSLDPLSAPFMVALGAAMVAAASATQDIIIDAFRVEYLDIEEQAAGTAYFVLAYRLGIVSGGAGTLFLIAELQSLAGVAQQDAWFYGYAAAACLVLVGICATLIAPPTLGKHDNPANPGALLTPLDRLKTNVIDSFRDFLTRSHAWSIVSFIILFKFCDAISGRMIAPFVLDIGFSITDYASIIKGIGFLAMITGGFAGGFIAKALSLRNAMLLSIFLQSASNTGFIWQAWIGPNHTSLAAVIVVEQFSGAIGTVIFVSYLAALCQNRLYTATHFAILTALSSVGRVIFSTASGFVAAYTGWMLFFSISVVTAIPSLLIFLQLARKGHFRDITRRESLDPGLDSSAPETRSTQPEQQRTTA